MSTVSRYVGDYTERNVELLRALNKEKLRDIDLVQPGTVLVVPDNRKNIFEPTSSSLPPNKSGSDIRGGDNILAAYV